MLTGRDSNGQAQLLRRRLLRGIHRQKPIDAFGGMEPERGSQVREVQRARRGDGRQQIRGDSRTVRAAILRRLHAGSSQGNLRDFSQSNCRFSTAVS